MNVASGPLLLSQMQSALLRPAQWRPVPVIVEHLSSLGADDVDDDPSVSPASLEQVAVLVALSRVEGLVQESPRQLLPSMDLQGPSRSYTNVLPAKVAVLRITVIRSENSHV